MTGNEPGISRVSGSASFRYVDAKGKLVRDPATRRRIQALVIPPNWQDVWICSHARGYLQATGRDARNRKQYRYHTEYRAAREQTKYEKMTLFGRLLPVIRRKVKRDLSLPGLPKDKVLATVVRLMDLAHIRVGNEEYAKQNQSFGLTTMRDRHVNIGGSRLHFQFRGKSGQTHVLDLRDRQLASIVKRCKDLPGYELFQYLDEDGSHLAVNSGMVNEYLREATAEDITAKDFRTWHGTVHAVEELEHCGPSDSEVEAKRNVVAAIKAVAELLGNRPATCRKYYVHPVVLDLYLTGTLTQKMTLRTTARNSRGLAPVERCVLRILLSVSEVNGGRAGTRTPGLLRVKQAL
ncbi:MAG: DNA topoisomerase IB, partial [Bryobacteraceae bacterium]